MKKLKKMTAPANRKGDELRNFLKMKFMKILLV